MAAGGGPNSGALVKPVGDVVDKIGSTVDANATVFDITLPSGLIGIGTLENTGAKDMIVRETLTDKFGNVVVQEHTVPFGFNYPLDPEANFGVPGAQAFPPFTEYKLEVRSASSGNPTTYELHYVDVAPASGPGTGGGGPPGTWTKVASGQTNVGSGATVDLVSAPLPGGATFVYVPFIVFDNPGGSPLFLSQGSTLADPPMGVVYYGFNFTGGNVTLEVRSGSGSPPCTLNWVLYKVVP
jgi:hypothetical protein